MLAEAHEADWVVASGSLPPEVPADVYARLCRSFAGAGIHVAVDTSGPAAGQRARRGPRPGQAQPGGAREASPAGRSCALGDVVEAAASSAPRGARTVLASLGADGAVLVEDSGIWYGEATVTEPRSSVGAGDAMLAGFLAGGARGEAALVEALAWGAAAVRLPGSRMPGPGDIRRDGVRTGRPDPARLLTSAVWSEAADPNPAGPSLTGPDHLGPAGAGLGEPGHHPPPASR